MTKPKIPVDDAHLYPAGDRVRGLKGTQNVRGDVVGEMNPTSVLVTPTRCFIRAPLTDAVRNRAGFASAGTLATLIDVGTSDPALAGCKPDWTATQDLSVYGAGQVTEGPIVVNCQLVRVGKKVIVVSAEVYDGHGLEDFAELAAAIDGLPVRQDTSVTLAATGLVTFARLPRAAASGVDDYDPGAWVGQVRHRAVSIPAAGSIYDRMSFGVLDAPTGQLELQRTSYVANSIGTINGGAQAMLIETAAQTVRPELTATDLQIHYLSQVKTGPARSAATVIRDAPDHAVVNIRLVDAGHDDQLLALATVTLQR
jgi:acyl-coenzyme A thioesterase PaaI-like protein